MDIEKVFAVNLKKIRKQKDMTQNELAQKSGVSIGTISSYESGIKSPSLLIVAKLAEALGVSIDELCGFNKGLISETGKGEKKQYPLPEILKAIQLLVDIGILEGKDQVAKRYTYEILNGGMTPREETLKAIELLPNYENWFLIDNPIICEFLKLTSQMQVLKDNNLLQVDIYNMGLEGVFNRFKDYIVVAGKNKDFSIYDPTDEDIPF